MKALRVKN